MVRRQTCERIGAARAPGLTACLLRSPICTFENPIDVMRCEACSQGRQTRKRGGAADDATFARPAKVAKVASKAKSKKPKSSPKAKAKKRPAVRPKPPAQSERSTASLSGGGGAAAGRASARGGTKKGVKRKAAPASRSAAPSRVNPYTADRHRQHEEGEEWSTLWPRLEALGWRHEDGKRVGTDNWYFP